MLDWLTRRMTSDVRPRAHSQPACHRWVEPARTSAGSGSGPSSGLQRRRHPRHRSHPEDAHGRAHRSVAVGPRPSGLSARPRAARRARSADLTGDGRTDLVAHSASGVLVWINTGTQFLPVPVTEVLTRGMVPLAGSSPDDETQTPAANDSDSDHTPPDLSPALHLSPGGVARLCTSTLDLAVPRRPDTASITRAPPAS